MALELIYESYTSCRITFIHSLKLWKNLIRTDEVYRSQNGPINTAHRMYYSIYNCKSQERLYFSKQTNELELEKDNSAAGNWSVEGVNYSYDIEISNEALNGRSTLKVLREGYFEAGGTTKTEFKLIELSELVHFIDTQYVLQIPIAARRHLPDKPEFRHYPIIARQSSIIDGFAMPALILAEINEVDADEFFQHFKF